MFEKYLEQKEQLLAEQLNLDNDFVNLYAILFNPKIEQSFKVYFSAEVDWWIYEEQIARSSNQRFNIDDPKLNAFLKQLDELYKKNARFSSLTLPQVINSAVKTRLNMLCRPRTAIKWFVYRWEQTKTYHEIVKRLNYLFDNKYLADGFIEHVQRKKLIKSPNDLIPISEFDKIINEIDNEHIQELSPEEFVQLMSPLFIFFNSEAEHKDTAKIPIEAVIIYFDDKNLYSLSTKLEQMFRSGELLLISKKYLLGFIYKSLYDADNLYGSEEDKVTKVTKEIEQANTNYLNMALSLKENMSKSQSFAEPISEEFADEVVPETITENNDFNLPGSFSFKVDFNESEMLAEPETTDEYDLSEINPESPVGEYSPELIETEIEGINEPLDNIEEVNSEIAVEEEIIVAVDNTTEEKIDSEEIDLSLYGFDLDGDSIVQMPVETEIVKPVVVLSNENNNEESEPIDETEVISNFTESVTKNKNKLADLLSALKDEFND